MSQRTTAITASIRSITQSLHGSLIESLIPTRCIGCEALAASPHDPLCDRCAEDLTPLEPPFCTRCGCSERLTPKGFPGQSDVCASCSCVPPSFEQARSCWSYEGPILTGWPRVKYGGELGRLRDISRHFVPWARRTLSYWVDDLGPLALVPVPLHDRALMERGFNQSALLARQICAAPLEGVEPRMNWITKIRHTPRQATLGRRARQQNLIGAFSHRGSEPAPRVAVILDDVYTTGATATQVALAMREAGAQHVLVMTMARALV